MQPIYSVLYKVGTGFFVTLEIEYLPHQVRYDREENRMKASGGGGECFTLCHQPRSYISQSEHEYQAGLPHNCFEIQSFNFLGFVHSHKGYVCEVSMLGAPRLLILYD